MINIFFKLFKPLIFLVLVLSPLACDKHQEHGQTSTKEQKPSKEGLFSWFLEHHAEQIADYDKDRHIIQIKVLDQKILGSRQCGYQAIRNMFYLCALSLAIEKKDSNLINKLYGELHDVSKFRAFVEALAKIKGCPIEEHTGLFPDKVQLTKLFADAPEGFPSSFGIDEILEYGVEVPSFSYYKYPEDYPISLKKEEKYLDFVNEYSKEFDINIPLNETQKKFLVGQWYIVSRLLNAVDDLEQKSVFGIDIFLEGNPSHVVAASVFKDTVDNKFNILFADSWGDLSFKTGWAQKSMDRLYESLTHPDEVRVVELIKWAYWLINKNSLSGDNKNSQSLKDIFKMLDQDKKKRDAAIKELNFWKQEFQDAVARDRLKKLPLYDIILKLIDKVYKKLER